MERRVSLITNSHCCSFRSRFGSELTLPDANEDLALSECQSEADLRGYATMTEDEDDRSVVSDFQHRRNRSSSGNLAARLGILPENRTILDFKEPGNVFSTTNGLQIKTYGLIDDVIKPEENKNRKSSHTGQESGYGSDGATTNSSRASPRGSLEGGEVSGNSVRDKIMAFQSRTETPSPPTMTKDARVNKPVNPPLLMPKPNKSTVLPPKKPARLKLAPKSDELAKNPSAAERTLAENSAPPKTQHAMIDVAIADDDEDCSEDFESKKVISLRKEYKMVRLIKEANQTNELGIIIAKKKLPELQPPVMGFQVVHIEPRGLIDR